MPIETNALLNFLNLNLAVKALLVLFLVFNIVYALVVFRQVQLMDKRLPTPFGPVLHFVSTVYIGASFAILLLVLGMF